MRIFFQRGKKLSGARGRALSGEKSHGGAVGEVGEFGADILPWFEAGGFDIVAQRGTFRLGYGF